MSMKQQLAERFVDEREEEIQSTVDVLGTMERNWRECLRALFEAHDIDQDLPELADQEDRVDELMALVRARIAGDPWGYWVDHQAPEGLQNPERAAQHAGKGSEAWEQQVEEWADRYRELLDGADDVPDRELATIAVEEAFGVGLETFEEEVVDWSPDEVMQRAVAGPTTALQDAVQEAATDG
jgi:hypothetical protein